MFAGLAENLNNKNGIPVLFTVIAALAVVWVCSHAIYEKEGGFLYWDDGKISKNSTPIVVVLVIASALVSILFCQGEAEARFYDKDVGWCVMMVSAMNILWSFLLIRCLHIAELCRKRDEIDRLDFSAQRRGDVVLPVWGKRVLALIAFILTVMIIFFLSMMQMDVLGCFA